MTSDSDESWKRLCVGDRIRIVRIPSTFLAPHYHNGDWDETFDVYEHLITGRQTLTISQIDEDGRPWIDFESTDSDGIIVSHSLSVDDDSWEPAKLG
ncbi:MAG: hypothetical protein AAFN77_24540 [Planctomycetota bacterium]